MGNKRAQGKKWEEYTAAYLASKEYTIIDKNYYTPYGEIDIIAEKEGILIFIEVKYRSSDRFGRGREAVGQKKQERIRRSALHYIGEKGAGNMDIRFDVVDIIGAGTDRQEINLEHIVNAF